MKGLINIDGNETRRQIDEAAGKSQSLRRMCEAKGLKPESLNRACLNGYGSAKIIMKYIRAGIPVVLSDKPVPSRKRRKHSRLNGRVPSGEQIGLETIYPKAFPAKTNDIERMKTVIIRHLESLIEELKEI